MDNVRDSPPEREGKQNIFDIDDSLKGRAALARLVFSTQILSTLGESRFRSEARGAPASAVRLGLTLDAPGQDGAPPQLSGLRRPVDGVGLPRAVPQLRRAAIRENLPASADVARSMKRWSNGSDSARCSPVKLLPRIARGVVRSLPFRDLRHRLFLRSSAATSGGTLPGAPRRVLVVGVYLAARDHSAEHLARAFAQVHPNIEVVQRWVAIGPAATGGELGRVTVLQVETALPKFVLLNRVLDDIDTGNFDYVLVVDDDIYLPRHFLPSFLAYQEAFDFALAQPARAWHSHFDHAIALRRPWLLARRTRFVECGPLVSFRRDAAAALLPFAHPQQLWGLDLVWPLAIERRSLRMGIIDAVSVDHSLRPQAAAYDKAQHDAAMHRFLDGTPHLPMAEAFTVLDRYRSMSPLSSA